MRLSLGSVATLTAVLTGALALWPDIAAVRGPARVRGSATAPTDDVAESFKVKVARPIARAVADSVISNGMLEPSQSVGIRPRVTGYLLMTEFPNGGPVKKGDRLFHLDGLLYEAELSKAKAELQRAQAYANRKKSEFEADDQARKPGGGGVTERGLGHKRSDWVEANASLASAQADVEIAQISVDYTTLTAPIAGRLSRPAIDVGNLITADQTKLATLAIVDPLVVNFTMSFDKYALLRQAIRDGEIKLSDVPVSIATSQAAGFHHNATLQSLEDGTVVNGEVNMLATLPNPDLTLLPGLSPIVRVPIGKPYPGLLVPVDAVTQYDSQGRGHVFVVNEQNTVVLREVTLSAMDGKFQVVRSGLKSDDWVAVEAARIGLFAGSTVEPIRTSIQP